MGIRVIKTFFTLTLKLTLTPVPVPVPELVKGGLVERGFNE